MAAKVVGPGDGKAGFLGSIGVRFADPGDHLACRLREVLRELVDLGGSTSAQPQALAELSARYELEVDPDSIPGLVERFGLRFPGESI
jgi:hypothetical protein